MLQRQNRAPRQCPDFPRSPGQSRRSQCDGRMWQWAMYTQSRVLSVALQQWPGSEAQLWKLDEEKCLHLSFLIIERCLCLWRSAVTRGWSWSRDWGPRQQRKRREQRTVLTREPGVSHRTRGEERLRHWYWKYLNCMVFIQSLVFDLDNANKDFFAFSE